ncbi:MAG: hypothetical protein M1819_003184 [Sarea resinae]|nr:MAG: hypothetical protein M1819_003184 [Sarea resinae]
MNPSSSSTNLASSSTSTITSAAIRPRNRKVNSSQGADFPVDASQTSGSSSQLISPLASPSPSRAVSPIPSKHPSRSLSSNAARQATSNSRPSPLGGFSLGGAQAVPTTFGSGLWENSWSTLQGLASSVLGNDTEDTKDKLGVPRAPRRRRPLESTHHRRTTSSAPPAQWGPTGLEENQIGVGSREPRESLLRAKQREGLLAANGHAAAGRHKRRVSDDRGSASAPPGDHEDRDALVYVHPVTPTDTLAGVMIKYNCQPAVFRKANGLWPNDSIQIRKHVVLPVDACAVKGRPTRQPPEQTDLLGDDLHLFEGQTNEDPSESNKPRSFHPRTCSTTSFSTDRSNPSQYEEQLPWKHDSWVLIDGHPNIVEIARIPRRALGFFPRSRRKSTSFSDMEVPSPPPPPPPVDNTTGSRSPSSHAHHRTSSFSQQHHRHKSRSSSASYFAAHLQGPGGVGTLEKDVTSPGPAQDGLSKLFASHLPSSSSISISHSHPYPSAFTFNPRDSLDSPVAASVDTSASSAVPPGAANNNNGGGVSGLENMGSAIEGWMRRLATKAAEMVEPSATAAESAVKAKAKSRALRSRAGAGAGAVGVPGISTSVSGPGSKSVGGSEGAGDGVVVVGEVAGGGGGDLIELSDAFDVGASTSDDERERDRVGRRARRSGELDVDVGDGGGGGSGNVRERLSSSMGRRTTPAGAAATTVTAAGAAGNGIAAAAGSSSVFGPNTHHHGQHHGQQQAFGSGLGSSKKAD